MPHTNTLLPVRKAARRLEGSRREAIWELYRLIDTGALAGYRIDDEIRVDEAELTTLTRARSQRPE